LGHGLHRVFGMLADMRGQQDRKLLLRTVVGTLASERAKL